MKTARAVKAKPTAVPSVPSAAAASTGPSRFAFFKNPAVKWLLLAVVALLCVYRIAVFRPEALDSPGTLRPLLYGWMSQAFTSVEANQGAINDWILYSVLALGVAVGLAFWNYYRRSKGRPVQKALESRWLFVAAILLALIVCRLPLFLLGEMNPDETQFLASANKLFYDPVFFRAVDCGTVGPLDIMPLMLPAVFGISPDYASSRLIGLIILFGALWFLYRATALLVPDYVARIAILPAVGAVAVLRVPDFIHFSSEHVPSLLIAIGLYLCVQVLVRPADYRWPLFWLGLLVMAAFFAKMQAVPVILASAFIAWLYVHMTRNAGPIWGPTVFFAAGLAPLWIVNAAICAYGGVWSDFWISYITGNVHYTDAGIAETFRSPSEQIETALLPRLQHFATYVVRHIEIRWLFISCLAVVGAAVAGKRAVIVGIAIAIAAALLGETEFSGWLVVMLLPLCALFWYRSRSSSSEAVRWFGLLVIGVLGATCVSVYVARNYFTHYLLLLVVPLAAALVWPVVAAGGRVALMTLLVGVSLAWQLYQIGTANPKYMPIIPRSVRSPESELIASLTKPGEQITVWGWNAKPYLGSGRVPATRDTNMTYLFRPPQSLVDYHLRRFLEDARRRPPAMFIDAVGVVGSREMADRQRFGYEVFPDVKAWVAANYVFLGDTNGERFFIRRDLATRGTSAGAVPTGAPVTGAPVSR